MEIKTFWLSDLIRYAAVFIIFCFAILKKKSIFLQALEDSGVDPTTFNFNDSGNVEQESKVDNGKTKVVQAEHSSEHEADLETIPNESQEVGVRLKN